MAVSPVNSGSNYVSKVQPQPQSQVERVADKENDNDSDDAKKAAADVVKKAAAVNVPVHPTVNTNGQMVGTVINVKG